MTQIPTEQMPPIEAESFKKIRRRNLVLGLAIGIFALTMIVLSYIMFSHYQFVPYETIK
ncbi:MAG: hypothetical protein L0Y74_02805 [candidate division Zixibacteria bacterium]|nr:hypothetical protein [candidate division Zixibacteria bacterium]